MTWNHVNERYRSGRSKSAKNVDNTINVIGSVVVAPKLSVRNRCMGAGVPKQIFRS